MSFILQDPDEALVHSIDWTDWIGSDTIASTASAVTPTGPTLVDLGSSGAISSAKLSGLTYGEKYDLTLQITTTTGAEIGERSISIVCGKR